jgi:hypothetical protein
LETVRPKPSSGREIDYIIKYWRVLPRSGSPVREQDLREEIGCRPFSFSLSLQPPWSMASDFQFHDHFTDGRTPWTSDQLIARPLPKHGTTQTQNKHIHYETSMPCVGFETTMPVSERALDRWATMTGECRPAHRIRTRSI